MKNTKAIFITLFMSAMIAACGDNSVPVAPIPIQTVVPNTVPYQTVNLPQPGQFNPQVDYALQSIVPMMDQNLGPIQVLNTFTMYGVVVEAGVYTWAQMYSTKILAMLNGCGCFTGNYSYTGLQAQGTSPWPYVNYSAFSGTPSTGYVSFARLPGYVYDFYYQVFKVLVSYNYSYYQPYYYQNQNFYYQDPYYAAQGIYQGGGNQTTIGGGLFIQTGNGTSIDLQGIFSRSRW